jgi:predicted small lipoprotein YifL
MKRFYLWKPIIPGRRYQIEFLCLFMLLFIVMTGCGKKALPLPPPEEIPPAVTDLTADLNGQVLTLSWSVPKGGTGDQLAGYKIYRSATPLQEADCRDCPVTFQVLDDVMVYESGATDSANGKMVYTKVLETDAVAMEPSEVPEDEVPLPAGAEIPESRIEYQYKVVGYTEYNVRSPDSNVVSAGQPAGNKKAQTKGGHEE